MLFNRQNPTREYLHAIPYYIQDPDTAYKQINSVIDNLPCSLCKQRTQIIKRHILPQRLFPPYIRVYLLHTIKNIMLWKQRIFYPWPAAPVAPVDLIDPTYWSISMRIKYYEAKIKYELIMNQIKEFSTVAND